MTIADPRDISRLETSAAKAAGLLRAMSNERRLMILCRLGEGEVQVAALQAAVGLSQSALSQHLAVLRDEGLIAARREGQAVFYHIADPAALRVIATLADIFCPSHLKGSK